MNDYSRARLARTRPERSGVAPALPHGEYTTALTIYATLAAALVAVVFLTNWPNYHMVARGGPAALYYYFIPGVLAIPILFAQPSAAIRFFREPMFWWFALYVGVGAVWLMFSADLGRVADEQWRARVVAFFFFYTITILVSQSNRTFVAYIILGCVLLASLANYLDVIFPYRFVPKGAATVNVERGAGFFMNPNAAAAFVLLGTVAAIPYVRSWLRGPMILLAAIGVAPCFSRFAFIFAGVLSVLAIFGRLLSRAQIALVIAAIPLLIAGAGLYYDFLLRAEQTKAADVQHRIAWFESWGDVDDESVEGRRFAAARAWNMFLDSPLYGHGIGATSLETMELGTHNMYVMLAAEHGLFGLALYIGLVLTIGWRGWRLRRVGLTPQDRDIGRGMCLYATFVAAYGFVTHNGLEGPHDLFIMAFVVAGGFCAGRAVQKPGAEPPRLRTPRLRGTTSSLGAPASKQSL